MFLEYVETVAGGIKDDAAEQRPDLEIMQSRQIIVVCIEGCPGFSMEFLRGIAPFYHLKKEHATKRNLLRLGIQNASREGEGPGRHSSRNHQ
jgi:hypothetical protein